MSFCIIYYTVVRYLKKKASGEELDRTYLKVFQTYKLIQAMRRNDECISVQSSAINPKRGLTYCILPANTLYEANFKYVFVFCVGVVKLLRAVSGPHKVWCK